MGWLITGNKNDIVLAVSENLICFGSGKQECLPPDCDDNTLLFKVRKAEVSWSIVPPTDGGKTFITVGEFERAQIVKNHPGNTHGMVNFYDSQDAIAFTFVVPETQFAHISRLLEMVLNSDSLQFIISISFVGFTNSGVKCEIPTWQEFISGKPYFVSEMSLTVKQGNFTGGTLADNK